MLKIFSKEYIRSQLLAQYSETDLKTWFDPLAISQLGEDRLEVTFPHMFFSSWFGKERSTAFEKDLEHIFTRPIHIQYVTPKNGEHKKLPVRFISPAPSSRLPENRDHWSFESFIYNKKNEFPVSVAMEIAANPTNPLYTPFVLCGKGSCGKTHLLRAMANMMSTLLRPESILLLSPEELQALFTEQSKAGSFRRKLLRAKAIFIDNAQDFSRFPDLQSEMANIIDICKDKKKPFTLSIDSNLDLSSFDERLCSRLESGLVVTIKKPDLDVRLRYAKTVFATNGLTIKEELLLSLAQQSQNIRLLQGIITKIVAFQRQHKKNLSMRDVEKIISGSTPLSARKITAENIVAQVAESFNLSPGDIMTASRNAELVLARQIAIFLCRDLLGFSASALGQYFAGRSHATVLHSCKKIQQLMDSNKDMNKIVTRIRKKFAS